MDSSNVDHELKSEKLVGASYCPFAMKDRTRWRSGEREREPRRENSR